MSRSRLLVAKLVSICVYVFLAVLAVAVTAYVVGINLLGSGSVGTSTVSGTPLTPSQLAIRTVLTILFIGWSMLGVGAVAFFISTLTDSPLAAALGGLTALVASTVLVTLDAAAVVRDFLPTRYWFAWIDFFRDPILWRDIERGVLVQAVYVAVLLGMSWANFSTRDITS